LTLRYLGWCPGIENVARWIPDKEYSNRRVAAVSVTVLSVLVGFSFYYSLVRVRPSYSWDIEFTDAAYDDAMDMYKITKNADIDGIYNVTIWADSKPGEYGLIRLLYQGPRDELAEKWKISNGLIQLHIQDEYGSRYSSSGTWRAATLWEIYSSSRDQIVHIRIQYLKERPAWQPP